MSGGVQIRRGSGPAAVDVECPDCHHKNKAGTANCANCGKDLQSQTQAPTNTPKKGFPWKKILIGIGVVIVAAAFIYLVAWGVNKGYNALFNRTPMATVEKAPTAAPAATKAAPTAKPLPSVVAAPGKVVSVKSAAKGCKPVDFTVPSTEGTYTVGDGTCAVTVKVTFVNVTEVPK